MNLQSVKVVKVVKWQYSVRVKLVSHNRMNHVPEKTVEIWVRSQRAERTVGVGPFGARRVRKRRHDGCATLIS